MSYRLEWIFQFRLLLSKATELHIPLTPAEQGRLERLRQQLPGQVPELDPSDASTRMPEPLRAQYVCGGRFHAGLVGNASGGGLALSTAELPQVGQLLQLHVWDPGHSVEYTFPSRVLAAARTQVTGIRVGFEGLPVQSLLLSPRLGLRAAVGESRGLWG